MLAYGDFRGDRKVHKLHQLLSTTGRDRTVRYVARCPPEYPEWNLSVSTRVSYGSYSAGLLDTLLGVGEDSGFQPPCLNVSLSPTDMRKREGICIHALFRHARDGGRLPVVALARNPSCSLSFIVLVRQGLVSVAGTGPVHAADIVRLRGGCLTGGFLRATRNIYSV